MNTTNLLMKIEHHADITEPEYLNQNDCLVITSPKCLTIKPREDAYLDLKFNMELQNLPDFQELLHMPRTWSKLSCTFIMMGLHVEDTENWTMNRTKNNTIQLHLLNRSHYYDVKIKKGDILGYTFLLGKLKSQNIKTI